MKLFEVTNTTWQKLQIAKHKSVQCAEWMTLICALRFADFLSLCLSPRTTSGTISFSISNSFWYYYLLSWLQIFQHGLSFWTSPVHLVFFLKSFRKQKSIRNTTENALVPSIFRSLSIATSLTASKTKRKIRCYRIFNFAPGVDIWTKNLLKRRFTLPGRLWRSINFSEVEIKKICNSLF